MEKTLSPDERIRRAEEIYYRRKMQDITRKSARVNVTNKKEFSLFKKMVIQILACILIYVGFYIIKEKDYIFSENVIQKANEILSYDINVKNLYDKSMEYINGFITNNTNIGPEEEVENISNTEDSENKEESVSSTEDSEGKEENVVDENSNNEENNEAEENIGGEDVEVKEEKEENLSQMEKDAKAILASKSLIIPLKGTITSRYGLRNPENPKVPKNHTGIDIAANEGTVFIASMSGVVEEVSSKGDLGNHVKITSDDVMTVYAHCKTIYVKKGDSIKQGQKIGEVGTTGNTTGPHLHFEIRKENRYVNPDLILKFE